MQSLSALNDRFSIPNLVRFEEGPGGLIRCQLTTDQAHATLYIQGAHLAHYQPVGQSPLLFMSQSSQFTPGKPIRGGVPICFPWFGPRAGDPAAPLHGFARIMPWTVEGITRKPDGAVEVTMLLNDDEQTRALWPHPFILKFRVTIGRALGMSLELRNPGPRSLTFEEALHTYVAVADVRDVSITGMNSVTYIDKTDAMKRKVQGPEPIRITAETDRVYLSTQAPCMVDDPKGRRRVTIDKSGSNTTVVWNPWIAKAKAMPDFGDEEWPGMLCIETANASENAVILPPGQSHTMTATIRAETR